MIRQINLPADVNVFAASPRFFAAIFVGFVLALALHLIFTQLAVLAGLAGAGDLEEVDTGGSSSGESKPWTERAKKAQAGIGLAIVLAGSIALFVSSWLGTSLALAVGPLPGIATGLAIWAVFYLAMTALELRAVTAVGGGLMRSAGAILSGTSASIANVLGRTQRQAQVKTAEDVAAAVRDEFLNDSRVESLRSELTRSLRRVRRGEVASDLGGQFKSALDDVEIRVQDEDRERTAVEASVSTGTHKREKVKSAASGMRDAASKIGRVAREEADSDKRPANSLIDAVIRLLGTGENGAATGERERIADELAATERQELDPDEIREEIELTLRDPRAGLDRLRERVRSFDRETVRALLLRSDRIDEQRADRILGTVESVVTKVRARLERDEDGAPSAPGLAPNSRHIHRTRIGDEEVAERRAANSGTDEEEGLLITLKDFFDDPRATLDSLRERASSMDRAELERLVAELPGIDEERARKLVASADEYRAEALARVESMQAEVERRIEASRAEALKRAEEVRQVAVHAAAWSLAIGLSTAAAAAAGGWVATL